MKEHLLIRLLASFLALLSGAAQSADQVFDLQAHRGGLGLVTESTIESFSNALSLGVSTLELDIQITEDGYAIVTHDRQVQAHKCRDTAPVGAGDAEFPYVGKFIRNLSLTQVRTLDCGFQQLPGFSRQRVIAGAAMPLLSEVFSLVKDRGARSIMLNIETKVEAGAPEETAPRELFIDVVLEEISKAGIEDQVTIQSFDWGTLTAIKERAPQLETIALTNGQSFLQCGMHSKSPWLGGLDMDDYNCDLVAAAVTLGVSAISPVHGEPQDGRIGDVDYKPFVTRDMVERAHASGLKVIPWTVDDKATMDYLVRLGVDGIITNYPDRLREVMAENGMTLPEKIPAN